MSTTKLTGRENWTKNTFSVCPVGPTDKENEEKMYKNQCSGSAWIRIKFVSWIRIRIPNANPDPAADKISSKSQNNSYHLELFVYLKNFLSYFFKF